VLVCELVCVCAGAFHSCVRAATAWTRGQAFGVLSGPYEDFNTDWYGNVGVTFILIVVVDNITHNLVMIVSMLIARVTRVCKRREVRGALWHAELHVRRRVRKHSYACVLAPEHMCLPGCT
jgi:hypothetical protein